MNITRDFLLKLAESAEDFADEIRFRLDQDAMPTKPLSPEAELYHQEFTAGMSAMRPPE